MNEEDELKNAAIYLYNEGKYEGALAKFLLTSQEDIGSSMMYLGFCYTRLNQHEAAINALESVNYELLSPSQYMQSKITLGYLYTENNQLDKADFLFESLSDYDSLNSQIWGLWGYIAQLKGHFDVAVRRYRKAIDLEPGNANALNSLAYLYATIDDQLEEAMAHARRAVAIAPQNASYLDTLGWICLKLNRKSDALEYLQRALSIRGNDPTIKEHLEAARQAVVKR